MLTSILLLIFLSFFIGTGVWLFFLYSVKKGDFDDIEGPKYRMLDDDDDLATFSISYGYEEEKSKNKMPGKWIKPGKAITIKGQTLTGVVALEGPCCYDLVHRSLVLNHCDR